MYVAKDYNKAYPISSYIRICATGIYFVIISAPHEYKTSILPCSCLMCLYMLNTHNQILLIQSSIAPCSYIANK